MDQERNITKTIWIVVTLFVFLAAVPLYADSPKQGEKTATKQEISKHKEVSELTAKEALLFRATDLIGSDVKTRASKPTGSEHPSSRTTREHPGEHPGAARRDEPKPAAEKIGTVGELVICDNVDKVAYVILNSQDKYYPVPWRAFHVHRTGMPAGSRQGPTEEELESLGAGWEQGLSTPEVSAPRRAGKAARPALFLNVTPEQLRRAPTIDSAISLEKLSDLKFYQEVDSFYSRQAGREPSRAEVAYEGPPELLKASKIKGLKVQDSSNADLGKIQDLLVDAREGHLAYGLVSFGGFLGIRDKTAVVPWSALSIRMEQRYARLDGSRRSLEAAVIDEDNLERLTEPQFARRIHDTFGTSPYWEVFGFVPGEEMPAPMDPWQSDSPYNKNFNPDTVTTIEGTIKSAGAFYPESGAAPGTRLDVETADGQTVTVYAGPRDFAARQGFEFKRESKITVTGSKTRVRDESVIMASEVRLGDKTMKLRDAQGKPEWKIEDLRPGK